MNPWVRLELNVGSMVCRVKQISIGFPAKIQCTIDVGAKPELLSHNEVEMRQISVNGNRAESKDPACQGARTGIAHLLLFRPKVRTLTLSPMDNATLPVLEESVGPEAVRHDLPYRCIQQSTVTPSRFSYVLRSTCNADTCPRYANRC